MGGMQVYYNIYMYYIIMYIVSGEANFVMEQTSLTVGGFTQPAVARSLIELPSNIEKGLSTRFLWIFPQPCYAKFESLQPVEEVFTSALGTNCVLTCYVQYVIVKAQLPGIYANKQTESESHIRRCFFKFIQG